MAFSWHLESLRKFPSTGTSTTAFVPFSAFQWHAEALEIAELFSDLNLNLTRSPPRRRMSGGATLARPRAAAQPPAYGASSTTARSRQDLVWPQSHARACSAVSSASVLLVASWEPIIF